MNAGTKSFWTFRTVRNTGTIGIVLVLSLMGLIPHYLIKDLNKSYQKINDDLSELIITIRMGEEFNQARDSFQALLEGDYSKNNDIINSMNKAILDANFLLENAESDEEKLQANDFITNAKRFKTSSTNYVEEMQYDPFADNAQEMKELVISFKSNASQSLGVFMQDIVKDIEGTRHAEKGRQQLSAYIIFFFLLSGLVICIFAAFFLGKALTRPIKELFAGANRFSEGDLTFRIPVRSNDEIGNLATAMNSMAEKIDSYQQELVLAKKHTENIVGSMFDSLIVVSSAGIIELANQATYNLLDLQPGSLSGRSFSSLVDAPNLQRDSFAAFAKKHENREIELNYIRSGGSPVPVSLFVTRMSGQQEKENSNFIITGHDLLDTKLARRLAYSNKDLHQEIITREKAEHKYRQLSKNLEIIIEERTAELVAASKAKSEFLANMSHEIRTPMNGIIGMTSLVKDTDLNAKQQDYINKIDFSAKNLLAIINDILDFSKVEANKLTLEAIDFYLEEVLVNTVNSISVIAKEKGLKVNLIIEEDVPFNLIGDPLRLGQVLLNLVHNAVKFTDKGHITIKTTLFKKTRTSITLSFAVTDTGCGITKETKVKLFEAFSQADTSTTRLHGGTGLGLTLSQRLTTMMGGTINVDSTPEKGSTFTFTAKFKLQDSDIIENSQLPDELHNLSVLVVDDDPTMLYIMSKMIASYPFKVTTATSGEEAVLIFKQSDPEQLPQIVFIDFYMVGLNGLESIKRIKSIIEPALHPVFIIVTGLDKEDIWQQAEEHEIDGVLLKPINRTTLLDTTLSALQKKKGTIDKSLNAFCLEKNILHDISGASVLVVEDNAINLQAAQELLEKAGMLVNTASNGQMCIEAIIRKEYDLVLMDIQMPVMDGLKACKKIRASGIPGSETLPIVAMTAHALEQDRKESIAAGMNDHITKPIDPKVLYTMLMKWIKPTTRPVPQKITDHISEKSKPAKTLPQNLPGINLQEGLSRVAGNTIIYINFLTQQSILKGLVYPI